MTRPRALVLAAVVLMSIPATAAPLLVAADIRIVVTSHTTCDVTMTLRMQDSTEIEHRIEAFHGSTVALDAVTGAQQIGQPRAIGRTQSLTVRVSQPEYALRYRAVQSAERQGRCPLWVPTVPASGQLGTVRIAVQLPDGSRPASAMPSFAWTGSAGTAALSHVPAFVRVSYAAPGEAASWDLLGVMDAAAVAVFLLASGLWLWRRARQRALRAA